MIYTYISCKCRLGIKASRSTRCSNWKSATIDLWWIPFQVRLSWSKTAWAQQSYIILVFFCSFPEHFTSYRFYLFYLFIHLFVYLFNYLFVYLLQFGRCIFKLLILLWKFVFHTFHWPSCMPTIVCSVFRLTSKLISRKSKRSLHCQAIIFVISCGFSQKGK